LDVYYEYETKLLTKSESVSINNILLDGKGTFEDKLRLYLIYYLTNNNNVSNSELEQFAQSLTPTNEQQEILLKSISFIKKWV